MKLLIVEDNPELSRSLLVYLGTEGYICELAEKLDEAIDKLISFDYDCVVLDIMLPDGNGLKLLEFMQVEQKYETGVIIISAKDATGDKVDALGLGADDYVTKPFHLSELNARLKSLYRRRNLGGKSTHIISYENISLDTQVMQAFVGQVPIELTQKEYELLLYFITNKNRILSRQAIASHLWGDYTDHLSNVDFIYQHVKNLRKKMAALTSTEYITTVYSLGYRFK